MSITDDEIALVERYAEAYRKEYAAQAQNQKIDSLNINISNSYSEQYLAIMERPDVKTVIDEESTLVDIYYQLEAVKSTNPDPALIDLLWLTDSIGRSTASASH